MPDGYGSPLWRTEFEIAADPVIDAEFALLLEPENEHSGELLGERCNTKFGRSGVATRTIRQAVAVPQEYFAATRNQDAAAIQPRLLDTAHVLAQDVVSADCSYFDRVEIHREWFGGGVGGCRERGSDGRQGCTGLGGRHGVCGWFGGHRNQPTFDGDRW